MFPSKIGHAPPYPVCHTWVQSLPCSHPVSHVPTQNLSCSHPKPVIFMPSWHIVTRILLNGVKRVKLWQFTLILLNRVKWVKLWQLTQSCRAGVPTIVLITHTSNSIGGGNIKDTGAVSCAVGLIGIILITPFWKWPGMWQCHCQYTQA